MFAVIILTYWFLAQQLLDITQVRDQATAIGITSTTIYVAGVLYWSFINSFIKPLA